MSSSGLDVKMWWLELSENVWWPSAIRSEEWVMDDQWWVRPEEWVMDQQPKWFRPEEWVMNDQSEFMLMSDDIESWIVVWILMKFWIKKWSLHRKFDRPGARPEERPEEWPDLEYDPTWWPEEWPEEWVPLPVTERRDFVLEYSTEVNIKDSCPSLSTRSYFYSLILKNFWEFWQLSGNPGIWTSKRDFCLKSDLVWRVYIWRVIWRMSNKDENASSVHVCSYKSYFLFACFKKTFGSSDNSAEIQEFGHKTYVYDGFFPEEWLRVRGRVFIWRVTWRVS